MDYTEQEIREMQEILEWVIAQSEDEKGGDIGDYADIL